MFNSLLNYGYGILYNRVQKALVDAGAALHVSFLHEPRDEKPTFRTLDLWEIKAGTEFNCQSLGLLTHRILSFLFRDTLFLSY